MKKYAIINGKELIIKKMSELINLDAFLVQYSEDNGIKKESLIVHEITSINWGIDINCNSNIEYQKLSSLEQKLDEVSSDDNSNELGSLLDEIQDVSGLIFDERERYDKKRITNFHK